jgi:aspartyl-tRNA(Asn)/glutamyl-tRNA(Gln) amidotransferase subunit A
VEDAGILYGVMQGGAPRVVSPMDVRGLTLGRLDGYFTALLDEDVARAFEEACARLARAGAVLERVEIPHADDIIPIYLHLVLAEAAEYHARTLEQRPDDYTPNVRIRLEMGRYLLAEDYLRARRGRDVLVREVQDALRGRAALLLPSLAIPPPKLGASTVRLGGSEESVRNVMLRLTQLFNITGHPAITLPCGTSREGLPIGLQLAGHDTAALLGVASAVEAHLR